MKLKEINLCSQLININNKCECLKRVPLFYYNREPEIYMKLISFLKPSKTTVRYKV